MNDEIITRVARVAASHVPLLGPAVDLASALIESNDERWRRAVQEEREQCLQDLAQTLEELKTRLEAVEKSVEAFSASRTESIFVAYLDQTRHALSPVKQEALRYATAALWDPTRGTIASRRYWLDAVGALSEMEVVAITSASVGVVVCFGERGAFGGTEKLVGRTAADLARGREELRRERPKSSTAEEADLEARHLASLTRLSEGGADGIALRDTFHALVGAKARYIDQLRGSHLEMTIGAVHGQFFTLSERGRVLATFMAPSLGHGEA